MAPTNALELQMAGHARLRLETAPGDSLYLALIDRQKRWLAVSPRVNDIYTVRQGIGTQDLLLVDSETDYDREGHRQRRRPHRSPRPQRVRSG